MTRRGDAAEDWAAQPLWWSERQRSRPLLWPGGADWFVNDPLGPLPHTHPGASEFYLLVAGTLDVTVGSTEITLTTGDLCLIPPDTFHHPRNQTAHDVRMLALVSPNVKHRRWKTAPFAPSDFVGVPTVARVHDTDDLPGDPRLRAVTRRLRAGQEWAHTNPDADTTVWVIDGRVDVTVGPLSGPVAPGYHVTAMTGIPYVASARGDSFVLIIEAFGDPAM